MTEAAALDILLKEDGLILAPGAYDALSARIARQAGAKAVYLSGFSVAGSALGLPDIGLMSAAEMTERVRAMAEAAGPAPLIADGDNGHGGPLQTARLTAAYEQAGAAGIQLEDQALPKRCGHMENKEVIGKEAAAAKIRAAVEARRSPAFKIIARTDARAPLGLDEALRRGEAFLEAGADILFIEAPQSLEEMEKIAATFKGAALTANMVEDGKTPYLDTGTLEAMGYKLALFPVSALLSAARLLENVYGGLLKEGRLPETQERVTFQRYNEIVGLPEMLADAAKFKTE